MGGDRRFVAIVAAAWLLFVAAVYLPDIGRGFVRDDFAWVAAGRTALHQPLRTVLLDTAGFYRPFVSLTFAGDYALHGLSPRGYGFSNLGLLFACVAALWVLCRRVGLSPVGASAAALAWSANPHGINMAVLWLSGRTALCLTLFALLAATAVVERRHGWAAVFLCGALASKEEAVALPLILFAWHELLVLRRARTPRSFVTLTAALLVPVAGYLLLRQQTAAFTPASAPSFYRFTFEWSAVLANAFAYLDRGATIAAILVALATITQWLIPAVTPERRRLMAAGAMWFAGGCAMTVFLPVRSSLYAVFPSVGAAIVCGSLVESIRSHAIARQRRTVPLEAIVATALLLSIPIYSARNDRWVEPARLSQRALRAITIETPPSPARGAIVLHDAADPASSFAGAFGTLATEAVQLYTGRGLQVWIEPPPAAWRIAGLTRPDPAAVVARFALDRGRIVRADN